MHTTMTLRKRLWITITACFIMIVGILLVIQLLYRYFPPTYTADISAIALTGNEPLLWSQYYGRQESDHAWMQLLHSNGTVLKAGQFIELFNLSSSSIFVQSFEDDDVTHPMIIEEYRDQALHQLTLPSDFSSAHLDMKLSPDGEYVLFYGQNPTRWYVWHRNTNEWSPNLFTELSIAFQQTDSDGNYSYVPEFGWLKDYKHRAYIILPNLNGDTYSIEHSDPVITYNEYDAATHQMDVYPSTSIAEVDYFIEKTYTSALIPSDCYLMNTQTIVEKIFPQKLCRLEERDTYIPSFHVPLIGKQKLVLHNTETNTDTIVSSWFGIHGRGLLYIVPWGENGLELVIIRDEVALLNPKTKQFAHLFTMPLEPTQKKNADGIYHLSLITVSQ